LIGPGRALDVLLSGRVFLAEEAMQMGVVNQVVPGEKLLEEATAYARDLAENCSPWSMAQIKRQVYGDFDRDLREALDSALELMAGSLQGVDFKEGVDSFL
jgi:enoyl-CoA hydratase/carnithine racemase